MIERLRPRLLGRHVGGRTQGRAGLGELAALADLRQTEVHHLDLALGGQHQVGALDIAVDDALFVRGFQALCRLSGEVERLLQRQRALAELFLDAVAFDELHRDEGLSIGFVDFVYGADVGVIQRRGGLRLAREARLMVFARQSVERREFEGDGALQFCVFGLVDDTHPTFADLLDDAVMGDGLADHGRLWRILVFPEAQGVQRT